MASLFNYPIVVLTAALGLMARLLRLIYRLIMTCARVAVVIVAAVVLFFSLANFVVSTPRVGAYRDLHPYLPLCAEGIDKGWRVLVDRDPSLKGTSDSSGWVDPSNNELLAVSKDKQWATKLRCSLQKHVVASNRGDAFDLSYYLGFIEFKETGEPYPLVELDAAGRAVAARPEVTNPHGKVQILTQLDALRTHLNTGSNYVIVFVHGWRHNASIGDGNVADLRRYAAHAKRFLNRRCEVAQLYCDTKVTAIYIGWRGARVDELWMRRALGGEIGGTLGTVAATTTLFDRKPVSEQVAPGAISALRAIERSLSPYDAAGKPKPEKRINRMIVFGHSLGGNMLATGLRDYLIKLVRSHDPGKAIPPALGDLTVLINPASEASKWTGLQREVWSRIPFHVDPSKTIEDVVAGHNFFPVDQKPVIISVTSARQFPPAGLRIADCEWFVMHPDTFEAIKNKGGLGAADVEYDWATQDLFPTFKLDFRPLAQHLRMTEAKMAGLSFPGQSCDSPTKLTSLQRFKALPFRVLASFLADFPFQNFNQEDSHTIGHLDPPRPADGLLSDLRYSSGAPFGTTHELFGRMKTGAEEQVPYWSLADAQLSCEPANHWLYLARVASAPHGTFWNSDVLGSVSSAAHEGPPAARFLHGIELSGSAAITRANDPFWNMRAYDNALARHDGYRLTSFICAMNQLVMDDITGAPVAIPNLALDPTQAASKTK